MATRTREPVKGGWETLDQFEETNRCTVVACGVVLQLTGYASVYN